MYSYLNELTLYAGVLYTQPSWYSFSSWPHIFRLFSNLHFLVLTFFYSRDVFGIGLQTTFRSLSQYSSLFHPYLTPIYLSIDLVAHDGYHGTRALDNWFCGTSALNCDSSVMVEIGSHWWLANPGHSIICSDCASYKKLLYLDNPPSHLLVWLSLLSSPKFNLYIQLSLFDTLLALLSLL